MTNLYRFIETLFLLAFAISPRSCQKTLCRDNNHVFGSWQMNESISKKNYHCCGYDGLDHRHDIALCGGITLTGLEEFQASNEWRTQSGGHACECDKREGRYTLNRRERYVWVPSNCSLLPWDSELFCKSLRNRTILFIGDSTMGQSANALMSMLHEASASCTSQIFFSRKYHDIGPFQGFISHLKKWNPSITILNYGAHAKDDRDIWTALSNIKRELDKPEFKNTHLSNISFVWRTNNGGHVNCGNYTAPSEFTYYDPSVDMYRWSLFPHWDEMGKNFSREMGWKVLDVSPMYSRHDAHPGRGDCLHYCLPGPIDLISTILLQMLYNNEI
jgi:hypothetical protein